jgi:stage II sporulation SpoE-like protein
VDARAQSRRPGDLLTVQPEAERSTDDAGGDERATLWAEPLQRLALALVRAVSLDDVAAALAAYGTMAAGAGWAHVLLLDHGKRLGVSLLGGPGVPLIRLDDLGLDSPLPWNDALRQGRALTFPSTDALYGAYPTLVPRLDLPTRGPVVTTPLMSVGEACGAVTFGFDGAGTEDGDAALDAVVTNIVALAGQAAARAALYASDRQSVDLLQRAYLPGRLSPLAGLSFATRYLPAEEPLPVGGDWYDVIALPGPEVGIVIGDVAGHGLKAAAVMASLRAALRAFAIVEAEPAAILSRLNDYTCQFKPDAFATVFVGVFDPTEERLRYASAGHPPALLLDGSSSPHLLGDALGPPLGLPGVRYESETRGFPVDAALLAYTDGLIERRDESLDSRLADLVAAAAAGGSSPEELCDRVVFELLAGRDLSDDAALIVASRDPGP